MSDEYLSQNSQLALQVLPEAVILVDRNHVIRFVNLAAVRLFEISDSAAVLGTSFSAFPGGSGLMTYSQRVAYCNHINEVATHKIPDPKPDDEQQWSTDVSDRLFNFRAVPMCAEQNQDCGFIICIEAWGGERTARELLYSLISELLTPLQSIRGYSELLLKDNPSGSLTQEQHEWATKVRENAKKLLEFREVIIVELDKQKVK